MPIAEVWGQRVLRRIRSETKCYAEVCVQLLDAVMNWVEGRSPAFPTHVVKAQRDVIRSDVQILEAVGQATADQLRDRVSRRLAVELEGSIRSRCTKFVAEGRNGQVGVKDRILKLFSELADQATEEAGHLAVEIIRGCLREVEGEVLAVLARHRDPLAAARDTILAALDGAGGGAHRLRQRVLDEAAKITDAMPADPGAPGSGVAA